MALLSGSGWTFSLTNPYGIHLVIPAHLSLFWVVCHPSRTFHPKELEREPQNRLPPFPHRQTIPSLTSDLWPTTHVLAGYKWVVLELCACSTFICVHGLSVVHAFAMTWGLVWFLLHVYLLILDLLWCGWITRFSFFISCFLPGLGLA